MRLRQVPDRIYIQFWGDESRPKDAMYDIDAEVTWCANKINASDALYVRASETVAKLLARIDELEGAAK